MSGEYVNLSSPVDLSCLRANCFWRNCIDARISRGVGA